MSSLLPLAKGPVQSQWAIGIIEDREQLHYKRVQARRNECNTEADPRRGMSVIGGER